ncbi:MAG: ABC transporter permease [Acidimicrobiales bacterium]
MSELTDDPIVREQLARQQARREDRREAIDRGVRQAVVFALFLVFIGVLYSVYKAFGQAIGDAQVDWPGIGSVLPRTDDLNMPPILEIVGELGRTPRGSDRVFAAFLLDEATFTFREAAVGFFVGLVVGLAIAIVLLRSRLLEQGFLPFVIASQTIPLVAIAPIVVIWGRKNFDFMPWEWRDWMSVSIIATYLTFFPVAVNGLRGLQAPRPENLELMDSYAASWTQILWRLRMPASMPYLFAAFKIAATASVVGAIVGEISAGVDGGLGRRILLEAQRYTTGPVRLYAAVLAAAALGVFVFLLIAASEKAVLGRDGREAVS